MATILEQTGQVALDVAALARKAIGPKGEALVITDPSDISLARASLVAKIADAALQILDAD